MDNTGWVDRQFNRQLHYGDSWFQRRKYLRCREQFMWFGASQDNDTDSNNSPGPAGSNYRQCFRMSGFIPDLQHNTGNRSDHLCMDIAGHVERKFFFSIHNRNRRIWRGNNFRYGRQYMRYKCRKHTECFSIGNSGSAGSDKR
jgi:hypothetical protein